ncbi:MAG TPA: sigma-70 family RNA polymerase sigma factor [Bryobacteraceae bacterium]|nr:sigma-70 family RNA polymerase sigma factor [Bryobacteraceae bacterium]
MADTTLGFPFPPTSGPCRLCSTPRESHSEEGCLIEALQTGREEGYEALIATFQEPVYNLVYRLMTDPSDASDVVQEIFLKIFRHIGSFQHKSSLKTWIYRISLNEAYNHSRWFGRHKRQEIGFETEEETATNYHDILADPGRSAFDLVSDRETQLLIQQALGDLNPKFRAAVVLRDLEDLSYDEIADVLQVSLGTVKSRILRGREALRTTLAGRLKPEPSMQWNPQPAR